jgi:hypothetical protein
VGPKTLPRHARPLAAGRWAGWPTVGRWASQIAERGLTPPSAAARELPGYPPADAEAAGPRRDPLLDPLAITEHCVIGDQIRLPAACCDIVGCGAEFADLAALGEADNRARALAAGWSVDAFGRLVCPACQQRPDVTRPRIPSPEPDTGTGPTSAAVRPGPRDGSPSRQAKVTGSHGEASPGRHRRAPWLHVLAALASGNNGWQAPQPVTGPRQPGPSGNPAGPRPGAA